MNKKQKMMGEDFKMAETLVRVHTRTHTHTCNLINKKEISIKGALLMMYRKDR